MLAHVSRKEKRNSQLYLATLPDNKTEYMHILAPCIESTLRPLQGFVNHGHSSLRPRTKKYPTAVVLRSCHCWSCDSRFVSLFPAMHGLGHLSCVTHPSTAVSSLWPGGWRWERLIVPVWWPLSWSHNSSWGWNLFSCQESESGASWKFLWDSRNITFQCYCKCSYFLCLQRHFIWNYITHN